MILLGVPAIREGIPPHFYAQVIHLVTDCFSLSGRGLSWHDFPHLLNITGISVFSYQEDCHLISNNIQILLCLNLIQSSLDIGSYPFLATHIRDIQERPFRLGPRCQPRIRGVAKFPLNFINACFGFIFATKTKKKKLPSNPATNPLG